jgi:intracellular septation protein
MKLILDFFPLAVFFLAYKFGNIMLATAAIVIATLLSLLISYLKDRRIAIAPMVSGIIITVFGSLTLALHDNRFIMMKPTLINLMFAAILLGGIARRKFLLKPLLESALSLTEHGWRVLTLRWAVFFVFLAGLNEIIWRNFSEDFWVNFKVFGFFPLTLLFTAAQYPLMRRCEIPTPEAHSEPSE